MYNYAENQIDAQIAIVARDAGRLQDKIAALGFATLRVWRENGGKYGAAEVAAKRLTALGSASPYHANAFAKWVAHIVKGRMVWNKEEKSWVAHADNFSFTGAEAKAALKEAKANPFFVFKPASEPKPYDDVDAFFAFYEQVQKKAKVSGTQDNVTVHPAFLNALNAFKKQVDEIKAAA